MDFFISYRHEDRRLAGEIAKLLESQGQTYFLAHEDMKPSKAFEDEIKNRLRKCSAVMAVITPSSEGAAYPNQEVGFAMGIGKPIIPLWFPGVKHTELGFLKAIQSIQASHENLRDAVVRAVKAANVENLGAQSETSVIPENLVPIYTDMRKTVKAWQEPSYASFSDWSRLDEEDPRAVIQIRRTAPDLASLLDTASSLFVEIWSLRTKVKEVIEEEQQRLAQEYQPRFDATPTVKFSFICVSSDGGNQDTLYLLHGWIRGETAKEHAIFAARARIPNMKTWELEVLITGRQGGRDVTVSVASGDEAVTFGQRILDHLKTLESARLLRDKIKELPSLGQQILPKIERELAKV